MAQIVPTKIGEVRCRIPKRVDDSSAGFDREDTARILLENSKRCSSPARQRHTPRPVILCLQQIAVRVGTIQLYSIPRKPCQLALPHTCFDRDHECGPKPRAGRLAGSIDKLPLLILHKPPVPAFWFSRTDAGLD